MPDAGVSVAQLAMLTANSLVGDCSMWAQGIATGIINDGSTRGGVDGVSCKAGVFGSMEMLRSDLQSFDGIDQGFISFDQALPTCNDGQCSAAELLGLVQQQQQLNVVEGMLEEQEIDAEIQRLLEIKAQMQAAKHPSQRVILETSQFQTTSTVSALDGCTGLTSLSPSTAIDSSLLAPSATIANGLDWPWMAGTDGAAAAAKNPSRHSVDLGGLALGLAAVDLNSNPNSFTLQSIPPSLNNSFTMQDAEQQQLVAALAATASYGASPTLAPAEAAVALPAINNIHLQSSLFMPAQSPVAAAMHSADAAAAGLISTTPATASVLPTSNNIHLQSALYMPAQLQAAAAISDTEVQIPAASRMLMPRGPQGSRPSAPRRMSLDLSRLSAYGSPSATAGAFLGHSMDAAATNSALTASQGPRPAAPRRMSVDLHRLPAYGGPATAAAASAARVGSIPGCNPLDAAATTAAIAGHNGGRAGCPPLNIHAQYASGNVPRRASIDLPRMTTPECHRPPRKTASMLRATSSSAGDAPSELSGLSTPSGRVPPRGSASVSTCTSSAGSARNSPDSKQQQGSSFAESCSQAKGPGARPHHPPVHQAPKWAGSHWDPLSDVRNGQSGKQGTGVFFPGGSMPKAADGAKA